MNLREKAQILNQMFRTQNKEKILEILNSPDIEAILKVEDQNRYTPLFSACSSLSQNLALQIVPLMLEKGANPFKIDKYSENVLYYIAKHGKDRLLKYLIERFKYDLNSKDENEQTPLFFAVSNNHLKCAQILITNGCNINHLDKYVQNCLFWAAGEGHLEMCRLLVNHGANFQQVDINKETAFHYAKKRKHLACQTYLQSLKQNAKNRKDMAKMESSQQESKGPRKKKELMKQEYCLIYTSQKGEVHELTAEELEQFGAANENNKRILDLMYRPEKLQSYPVPEEKRYQKLANKILTHFTKHEQGSLFLFPVDPVALNIPHYPTIVKHPMDFTTIRTKLQYNAYDNEGDFNADMNLVFDNCVLFNGRESSYGKIATQMRLEFNTMYKKEFGI